MATGLASRSGGRARRRWWWIVPVVVAAGLFGWWLVSCEPVLRDLDRLEREGLVGEKIHWRRDEVEAAIDQARVARVVGFDEHLIRRVQCDFDDPVYNYASTNCEVYGAGSPPQLLGEIEIFVTDGGSGPEIDYSLPPDPLDASSLEACETIREAEKVLAYSANSATPEYAAYIETLKTRVPAQLRASGTDGAGRVADLLEARDLGALDPVDRLDSVRGALFWCTEHSSSTAGP